MKQIFRMTSSQLLSYIEQTAEAAESITKKIQGEKRETILRALESTLDYRKKRNKVAHLRLEAMQKNENSELIEVVFGYFTFLEQERDGDFMTLIHSVDTIEYHSRENLDKACENGLDAYESYIVPSQYNGIIRID